MERFDQKASKAMEHHRKNKKIRIEKAMVAGALIVILIALLVIPKYETYRESKLILEERVRYNLELPDEMTEETYLRQLKTIGEQLSENQRKLPESLDTVSLYEMVAKMAESAKVGLISLEFGSADIQIDDRLGTRIDADFLENEDKVITGPDGKYLTTCGFAVVCFGNDQKFMAFLNELNQCSPVIRVISCEIEKGPADEKQMRLKLESYGIKENTPAKAENTAVYQQ